MAFPSVVVALLLPCIPARADVGNVGPWGDQGNGTYKNPIIPGDYSDVDAIGVDSTYYIISSTFQFSPGVVILKSTDMVNWTIAGHAVDDITQMGPAYNYTSMSRSGHGIWAGAIRYHAGRFWIYYLTPDEGLFMTTAAQVEGPWDPLTRVVEDNDANFPLSGWDDCCPFWDDDGQEYLVTSNYGGGYKIHLFKVTADGKKLLSASDIVIHQSSGSEANKLYKINGTYYHLFSQTGNAGDGRDVMMEKASKVTGPYTGSQVLMHCKVADREPNQGGLVQDRVGKWWFLTHQGTGKVPEGRTDCLLPVTWTNGWPIIGTVGADGVGNMVWSSAKPIAGGPIVRPQSSDDFTGTAISPQWEWFYQPRADKWSLSARPGFLRLSAFKPLGGGGFFKAGNTLSQRFMRSDSGTAIVKIDVSKMADGQEAGMSLFDGGSNYATVGVVQANGARTFRFTTNGTVTNGDQVPAGQTSVWLKSFIDKSAQSVFSFSLDGAAYKGIGGMYALTWGNYRGTRIGIYTFNTTSETGYVDVDWFTYNYAGPRATDAIAPAMEWNPSSHVSEFLGVSGARGGAECEFLFRSAEPSRQVAIYTLRGKLIHVHGAEAASSVWNRRDDAGSPVVPGIYLLRISGKDPEPSRIIQLL
jgi:beta-xylosidase